MRVIDLINSNEKTAFSFEILPPLKGTGIEKLYQTIDTLREFDPKYINITTHRSEYVYKDLGNGLFQRNRLRRRPGTVAVAAAIQNKYNITMVPHILCSGFTREETEYVLLDLQFLGITDLLVLRGDKAKHESSFIPVGNGYHHAVELQEQINNFNKGIFVDGSEMKVTNTPFSYGVACYPEKHEAGTTPTERTVPRLQPHRLRRSAPLVRTAEDVERSERNLQIHLCLQPLTRRRPAQLRVGSGHQHTRR